MSKYNNKNDFTYDVQVYALKQIGFTTPGWFTREVTENKYRKLIAHDDTRGGQVRQNPNRFIGFGRW